VQLTYLNEIEKQYNSGNATEHSYRGALQKLLEEIIDNEDIVVTNEPKRAKCGAPDYIISKKIKGQQQEDIPLGFVEAKDIVRDIDSKEYKRVGSSKALFVSCNSTHTPLPFSSKSLSQ
jgi:hypothetical protein